MGFADVWVGGVSEGEGGGKGEVPIRMREGVGWVIRSLICGGG